MLCIVNQTLILVTNVCNGGGGVGFQSLNPSLRGFESRSGQKLSCGEVFQLTCGASVVLHIHANISIFVRVGSSSTTNSLKSPYDPKGVGATENPINKENKALYTHFCPQKRFYWSPV